MDPDILQGFASPVIVALCFCIGYIVRNVVPNGSANRFIPMIVGLVGIVAAVVMNYAVGIGTDNVVQIVVAGLVSGLASTGCYEAFKNIKGGEADE